jgi:hypothetical protein
VNEESWTWSPQKDDGARLTSAQIAAHCVSELQQAYLATESAPSE